MKKLMTTISFAIVVLFLTHPVLSEIVIIDDGAAGYSESGSWSPGSASSDKYGADYHYATVTSGSPTATATWQPTLTQTSAYVVSAWFPQGTNRSLDAAFTVNHGNESETLYINQTTHGGQWVRLGTFACTSGNGNSVVLTNQGASAGRLVMADAVKFETYSFPTARTGGEFRAYWADGWGSGFQTLAECQGTIDTARRYNLNAVVVEIRKRGDAYYNSSLEPRPLPTFDSLSALISIAHDTSGGKPYIEVHAWMVAMQIFSGTSSSANSGHVIKQHPEWLTLDTSGNSNDGSNSYYIDPGNPDASDYNAQVYSDISRNYDIDGISFDYIRTDGNKWGYNSTAIARFNAEFGRTGQPTYTDNTFDQWRRDNISAFVKRVYANVMDINPKIKIGACTVHFGTTGSACFDDATTYEFQQWDKWLREHFLDVNMPMIYKSTYSWYTNVVDFDYNRAITYNRHTYPIQGTYLNTTAATADQVLFTRAHSQYKGMSLYDNRDTNTEGISLANCYGMLSARFFSSPTYTPSMPWKTNPTTGILKGYIISTSTSPAPYYNGKKTYKSMVTYSGLSGSGTTYSDLVGFYSFMDVPPGTYTIKAYLPPSQTTFATVANKTISTGLVTHVNIDISPVGTKLEDWPKY